METGECSIELKYFIALGFGVAGELAEDHLGEAGVHFFAFFVEAAGGGDASGFVDLVFAGVEGGEVFL